MNIWTDKATGIVYDADTLIPLPTVGDDLGEKPSLRDDTAALPTDSDATGFAALLGIDPETT